ncbi:MAG: late competence development ComFB family protein [Coleofasciculaceae cyanobacterium]
MNYYGSENHSALSEKTNAEGQVEQRNQARTYQNVMEWLVAREIEQQHLQLPPEVAISVNTTEVAAYALNRLPPLYASSEEGWRYQQIRGKLKFSKLIMTVVRQAFAAVQRDKSRNSTPLKEKKDLKTRIAKPVDDKPLASQQQRKMASSNPTNKVRQMPTQKAREKTSKQFRNELPAQAVGWGNSLYSL